MNDDKLKNDELKEEKNGKLYFILLALLLVVLALFTLFSYKAPHGMKAMGALANAACASFLVEAFHASLFGTQMGISFLQGVGDASGSLGGVAAGILVPLALGVSPAYAVLVGLTVSGFGILPGFIAGYLISFVVKLLEKFMILIKNGRLIDPIRREQL